MKFHEMSRTAKRILCAIICMLVLAMPGALASEPAPTPSPVPVPEGVSVACPHYGSNSELLKIKDQLLIMGYYVSTVTEADLRSPVLDDITMLAVKDVCRANNLEYSDYGIVPATWDAILSGNIKPNGTTAYSHIYWSENSDAVRRIQAKLQQLGYGADMVPGLYDEHMYAAVEAFCKTNDYAYSQQAEQGLSPDFQKALLEGSNWKGPNRGASGFLQKLRTYFTGEAVIFGLQVPMLLVWGVCLVLLVGCVLLIIHFFVPSDENKGADPIDSTSVRRTPPLQPGALTFVIEYEGKTWSHKCKLTDEVRIGRTVGTFPLNDADKRISRKHCEIYYNNGSLMLRDYSTNTTFVNGVQNAHGECILRSGDVLQIGGHKVSVYF